MAGGGSQKEFGEGLLALPESFAVCLRLPVGLTSLGSLVGLGALGILGFPGEDLAVAGVHLHLP